MAILPKRLPCRPPLLAVLSDEKRVRSYKRRDCCALARILRAERINVCKYIPFFLISTLSVGQYRFEIVFSIDGAFLSATSVLPTMSTKNTTKVYQKGHKSPFFSLKKANWKLWSCTFGRVVGNTGFEIGKRQRHILPTAKRIWLTHCCQIGRLSFLLPFFRSLISSLFFEILWLMLYGIFLYSIDIWPFLRQKNFGSIWIWFGNKWDPVFNSVFSVLRTSGLTDFSFRWIDSFYNLLHDNLLDCAYIFLVTLKSYSKKRNLWRLENPYSVLLQMSKVLRGATKTPMTSWLHSKWPISIQKLRWLFHSANLL